MNSFINDVGLTESRTASLFSRGTFFSGLKAMNVKDLVITAAVVVAVFLLFKMLYDKMLKPKLDAMSSKSAAKTKRSTYYD